MNHYEQTLQQAFQEIGLPIKADVVDQLLAFITFLKKWNKAFNLTAIQDDEKMITHHLLDSLVIAPYLKNANQVLDVGSGAGFPGIPLAMLYPDKKFTLLDSNGKKTRFLSQVKAEFHLSHLTVIQSRVESYDNPGAFDTIICRAVGTIDEIWSKAKHLLSPGGQMLLMKGIYPEAVLTNFQTPYRVYPLQVPGLDAKRHLVMVGEEMSVD